MMHMKNVQPSPLMIAPTSWCHCIITTSSPCPQISLCCHCFFYLLFLIPTTEPLLAKNALSGTEFHVDDGAHKMVSLPHTFRIAGCTSIRYLWCSATVVHTPIFSCIPCTPHQMLPLVGLAKDVFWGTTMH